MDENQVRLLQQDKHTFHKSRYQSLIYNYDPSAYPPDLQVARQHGLAQRVGEYIPPQQDAIRCRCCLNPINKKPIPLCAQYSSFAHIGCCYPLYFYLIKLCLSLLTLNIILVAIPNTIINLTQGNMCQQIDGLLSGFYSTVCNMSVINIMNVSQIDSLEIQAIFSFIAIILSIILVAYLDIQLENKYKQLCHGYNASDFSIMLKGLPKDITIYEIQKFVEDKLKYLGADDTTIEKIYIIYNLKTFSVLYQNKQELVDQLPQLQAKHRKLQRKNRKQTNLLKKAKIMTKIQNVLDEKNQLENRIEMIEIQINNYEESFKILAQQLKNQKLLEGGLQGYQLKFSGKCIVTLNSIISKKIIIQNKRKTTNCWQNMGYVLGQLLGGKKGTLVISQAPQPSDIIYSNMGSQKYVRWRNQILVSLLIAFLILLDFVFLTISKKLVKEQKSISPSNIILSFINSQLIALMNSLLSRVIKMSENKSFYTTKSSYNSSVSKKLVYLYLINMLGTTFFSNIVSFYLITEGKATFGIFPLNFQQFLFDVFFLILTNPFTTYFMMFFDHRQGTKLFYRNRIQNGSPVTQAEANLTYQNCQIDISRKYGNVYRFMMFTAGIAIIYPLSLVICFLSLIGFYWLDKYLLLRLYVVPKLGYRVSENAQKLLGLFPLLLSISNLVIMFIPIGDGSAFKQQKYSKTFYYLAIVAFIISLIIYLIGNAFIKYIIKAIIKCFSRSKSINLEQTTVEYRQIESLLQQDYWHQYPYFKVRKSTKPQGEVTSPRKQKIDELNKKMTINVFSVIKDYLNHSKYAAPT